MRGFLQCLAWLGLFATCGAQAVHVDADGHGQALVFPYYIARSEGAAAWYTYLSIANHSGRAKALRVRLREARSGREVLAFNLFLHADDTWAGAAGQPAASAPLVFFTTDVSCMHPKVPHEGIPIAAADGEGYVEVLEMAALRGPAAQAVAVGTSGVPNNCAAVAGDLPASDLDAPTGGLSGTLSLVDIRSGFDITVRAEALAGLANAPFYRPPSDPYPDFTAAEIDRGSFHVAGAREYRLQWGTGVEAVSAALTRSLVINEFVRDAATASSTDWVLTLPMKRFAATPSCIAVGGERYDREHRSTGVATFTDAGGSLCHAANVGAIVNEAVATSPLLGGRNLYQGVPLGDARLESGWMRLGFGAVGSVSLPGSTVHDRERAVTESGRFRVIGQPVLGFAARTFVNGSVPCAAGSCLGNYGGSFPHRYETLVVPAP
jgi:hypothetical protein